MDHELHLLNIVAQYTVDLVAHSFPVGGSEINVNLVGNLADFPDKETLNFLGALLSETSTFMDKLDRGAQGTIRAFSLFPIVIPYL